MSSSTDRDSRSLTRRSLISYAPFERPSVWREVGPVYRARAIPRPVSCPNSWPPVRASCAPIAPTTP